MTYRFLHVKHEVKKGGISSADTIILQRDAFCKLFLKNGGGISLPILSLLPLRFAKKRRDPPRLSVQHSTIFHRNTVKIFPVV